MKKLTFSIACLTLCFFIACSSESKESKDGSRTGDKSETTIEQEYQESRSVDSKEINLKEGIQSMDAADFAKSTEVVSGIQIVDVRTKEEYDRGHFGNAVNMDFYQDDFKDKLATLNKEQPVFVYCESGGRSSKTAKMLKEMGFKEIVNMQGGWAAWQEMNGK